MIDEDLLSISGANVLDEVPFLDLEVSVDSVEEVAEGAKLALDHFIPNWNVERLRNFQLTAMTDGLTNKLFKVKSELGTLRSSLSGHCTHNALVRVYGHGTEKLIDREQEMLTMWCLSKNGLSPPLYGRFRNGICYGYLEGRPFTPEDMVNPSLSLLVADQLARFHCTRIYTRLASREPRLFHTIRKWLDELQPEDTDVAHQRAIDENINKNQQPPFVQDEINLTRLREEIEWLDAKIQSMNCDVVFCHNDLLCGNIIHQERAGEEPRVCFIDYEYGNYNFLAFDIGNHWAEMLGFRVEIEREQSDEFYLAWLREYVRTTRQLKHPSLSRDDEAIDADVQRLFDHARKFSLISHLHWGIWALVQNRLSDNSQFDYQHYALTKISFYFRHKPSRFGTGSQ